MGIAALNPSYGARVNLPQPLFVQRGGVALGLS